MERGLERRRGWVIALVVAVASTATAACTSSAGDKAGSETVVIRLATIDEVNNNGESFGPEAFVQRLAEVSDGRLKVEVLRNYGDGQADAESRIVQDIAAGEVDGGWPSVRAFADAGIEGVGAVEAPLTIVNYDAERDLVGGPAADEVARLLEGSGVAGLGLAVGPLRRPFAAGAPLLSPDDWAGQAFRVYNSPLQSAAVSAWGGEAVNLGFGELAGQIADGALRGVELDIAQAFFSGGNPDIGNVTANVVLWPKVFVLAFSQERLDGLTEQQRAWVRQAAEDATQASVDATYDESGAATKLCGQGLRFRSATDDDLQALREALEPVYAELAAGGGAALLDMVRESAARHPDAEPIDVPEECAEGVADATATGPIPSEVSTLPTGTYRVEITPEDLDRVGMANGPGHTGLWTLAVADGHYQITCRPTTLPGIDCGHEETDLPLDAGDLRGRGSDAYFVLDVERLSELNGCKLPATKTGEDGWCWDAMPYKLSWRLDGADLSFDDYVGLGADPMFVVKPWTRVG